MTYIKAEHVKYRYPNTKRLALDDLNFEIEKGSFIGLVGENGAGKSTLCQAFSGLVPGFFKGAYGGKLLVDGIETGKTPVSKLCRKVGLVFQNPFNQLSGAKETVFEEIVYIIQHTVCIAPVSERVVKCRHTAHTQFIDRRTTQIGHCIIGSTIQKIIIETIRTVGYAIISFV